MAAINLIGLLFLLTFTTFACAQSDWAIRQALPRDDDDVLSWLLEDDDNIVTIRLYSNFDSENDRRFFRDTLPWLVDNIGNRLRINYRFRDSGRSTGPRMCVLRSMHKNTFLQSEFLRCEARGTPMATCVTQSGVNTRAFNRCLRDRVNSYVRNSQDDFDDLIAEGTPVVLVNGNREVNTNNPTRLLRLICQRYGRSRPSGCQSPTAFPNNTNQ